MTVKENVMAAQYGHTKSTIVEQMLRLPRARREERQISAFAEEKLGFFGERLMGYRWNQPAYSCPTRTGGGSRSRGPRRAGRGSSFSTSLPLA